MQDIKLSDISERIVEAVLAEAYLDRENLNKIVKPILKIWLKKADSPKSQKAPRSRLQKAVESRELQQQFWKNKTKQVSSKVQMEDYYLELDKLLKQNGFKD